MSVLETVPTVTTFPIGTRSMEPKIGLLVPPVVGSVLAANIGGDFIPALNTLDSYKAGREIHVPPYIEAMQNAGVQYESIWHDAEQKDQLMEPVERLYKDGYLRAESREVMCCPCGKVERLSGAAIQPDARLYRIADTESGLTVCRSCDGECSRRTEDVLVMHFPETLDVPETEPSPMRKEVATLMSRLQGMEYLASRTNRDTGITLELGGTKYQLDVDFFWSNYLSLLPAGQKFVVGTSHVAWHLCLAQALQQCVSKHESARTGLVLAPYIYPPNEERESAFDAQEKLLPMLLTRDAAVPLTMLLSMAWSKQSGTWKGSSFNYLTRKLSAESRTRVWQEVSCRRTAPELQQQVGKTAVQAAIDNIRPTKIMQRLVAERKRAPL